MSPNRCARCGRDRPAGIFDSEGAATGNRLPPYGVSEAAWASFEGRDVCPQCQSPDERLEAARRIDAMIEREIERRQQKGIPPDRYEAALVNYAMAIRARFAADTAQRDRVPDPAHGSAPANRSSGLRLRVAFTGAFLTGHPLAVPIDGYDKLQRELGGRLAAPQWSTESLRAQAGTYESGGGFTEHVPLVIARREGADLLPWLSSALDDSGHADASPLRRFAPALDAATPKSLAVEIYDLGVAVISAEFDVVATAGAEAEETARAVKELALLRPIGGEGRSPLAEELQKIASVISGQYGEAVTTAAPQELQHASWLSRADNRPPDEGRPLDNRPPDEGRLLWLHPVQVLEGVPDIAEDLAIALAPAFSEIIKLDGGVFVAGIGWSVVVVTGRNAEVTPVRLTELHWAYYALYMEIDRGLLDVLNQPRWRQRAPLKQLETDADNVFADYLRVMDARARLDSALSARGGDELAIWETIAKVQKFDTLLDAVGRKLDTLEKVAQHRIDQTTAVRDRRIGYILGFLAVLGVVTLAIAIVGAVVGAVPGVGPVWVRVAIIIGAFAVAACLFWAFFVRTTRAPTSLMRHRRKS